MSDSLRPRKYPDHDAILERLGEQAESLGIRSLKVEERHLLVAATGYGLIGNGGFFWLYQGFTELDLLVEAFEALGFPEAAAACSATVLDLPNGVPFLELDSQVNWLLAQSEAEAPFLDRWESLEEQILVISDAGFTESIEMYLRARPQIRSST